MGLAARGRRPSCWVCVCFWLEERLNCSWERLANNLRVESREEWRVEEEQRSSYLLRRSRLYCVMGDSDSDRWWGACAPLIALRAATYYDVDTPDSLVRLTARDGMNHKTPSLIKRPIGGTFSRHVVFH